MLVHHADAGIERCAGLTRSKPFSEDLDIALIGRVVTEEDVHQCGLAGTVLTEKSHHLAALERQRDGIVRGQFAEAFCDPRKAENLLRLSPGAVVHQLDFGSSSLISTVNSPDLMALRFSSTIFMASSGTLPSKVPSGASDAPPSFMKE